MNIKIWLGIGMMALITACGQTPQTTTPLTTAVAVKPGIRADTLQSQAAAVTTPTPTLISGNPKCSELIPKQVYGYKPNEGTPNEAVAGTFTDPTTGVTITWSYISGLNTIQWSATYGGQPFNIDAVIVKGSNAANVYVYNPEASSNSGLVTPVNASGNNAAVSHVEFCYDFEVLVSKTAVTSYTRTYNWTIDKSSPTTALTLTPGQSFPVNYAVKVNSTFQDSAWTVTGAVTIKNPDPNNNAVLTGLNDEITPGPVPVTTDCTFPQKLLAGATLTCNYSVALGAATNGVNTATVTTDRINYLVGGGSGTAAVTFGDPTTKVDACITVTDDNGTPANPSDDTVLGTVCEQAEKTFNYAISIRYDTCNATAYSFVNTASFLTNTSNTGSSDNHTVSVAVPCAGGCTLTQGYWKTHSNKGPAPYDDAWKNLSALEEATVFFSSGKTWLGVFQTPPKGNAYFNLAHQYMAARLNVLNGASTTPAVDAALAWATTFFGANTPSTALSASIKNQVLSNASLLDQYNNGLVGPGHCSE
jgi:hypothetical protein